MKQNSGEIKMISKKYHLAPLIEKYVVIWQHDRLIKSMHQFYTPQKHFCIFDRLRYLIIKVSVCLYKIQLSKEI